MMIDFGQKIAKNIAKSKKPKKRPADLQRKILNSVLKPLYSSMS